MLSIQNIYNLVRSAKKLKHAPTTVIYECQLRSRCHTPHHTKTQPHAHSAYIYAKNAAATMIHTQINAPHTTTLADTTSTIVVVVRNTVCPRLAPIEVKRELTDARRCCTQIDRRRRTRMRRRNDRQRTFIDVATPRRRCARCATSIMLPPPFHPRSSAFEFVHSSPPSCHRSLLLL